ncbi:MFS transporter [Streptomyces sp. NBC_01304]|uniref:MFS transporter n=1 Tax=Streptomyces sp. NBC_01304 TaxID=2903818 RepID=UPI002E118A13|nr:MFS transporter [Streptomyces sp. NBC_01304]
MSTTVLRVTESAPVPRAPRWPPAIWALLGGTFVVRALGYSYPFMAYHLAEIHFSTQSIGQILATFGAGWLAGQLLCGWLADRIGRRSTLVAAMLLAALVLPLLAAARAPIAVYGGAFVVGLVYDAPRPVVSAAIADLITEPARRAKINAARHFVINVGAALTGCVGGLLVKPVGMTTLFWANSAACVTFCAIALRYLDREQCRETAARGRGWGRAALRDGRLWLLSLSSLATLTCAAALFSALPMLMSEDGLDASAYGLTQVANALTVVVATPLMAPWLSRRADTGAPMVRLLALSAVLLGVGMGSAALASTTLEYSLAVMLAVPGEIIFFVCADNILNLIAPASARGIYHGAWGTTLAGAVIVAPAMTAWALGHGGKSLAAASIFTAGLLGAALCLPLAALLHRWSAPPALPASPAAWKPKGADL